MLWQAAAAILIFAVSYILVLAEKWNRSYIALGGAACMLLLGAIPLRSAALLDWNTLLLIGSFAVFAGLFRNNGLISYAAAALIRSNRAHPLQLFALLSAFTALGAALFDGIAVIAAVVPLTIAMTRMLQMSPFPFLIAQIFAANLGGAATLVGSAPNRLIGGSVPLPYHQFLAAMLPLMAVLLVVSLTAVALLYKRQMSVNEARKRELLSLKPGDYLGGRLQVLGGGAAAALTLIGLLLQGVLNWPVSVITSAGALMMAAFHYKELMAFIKPANARAVWQGVLDSQVLFIAGLLLMVSGLVHTGIASFAAAKGLELSQGSVSFLAMLILWLTSLGSAALDCVPYIAAMVPVIQQMGQVLQATGGDSIGPLWWALAVGAAIGGCGTLAGSLVSMVAAGLSAQEGADIPHGAYLKIAGPLAIAMTAIASLYIYIFLL